MPALSHVKPVRVVFDGQSLNLIGQYPSQLMARYPGVDWVVEAIGSQPWQTLMATSWRVDRWANMSQYSIYMMNGGSSNIFLGTMTESGAAAASREASVAQGRKAVGYDYVINMTLTPFGGGTAPQETERLAFNSARIANTTDWTSCVDIHTLVPESRDPNNTTWYDALALHWKIALGLKIADAVAPVLTSVLTSVGAYP
jgi:hypothetical protein